jgi:hypothetical protein
MADPHTTIQVKKKEEAVEVEVEVESKTTNNIHDVSQEKHHNQLHIA